MFDSERPEAYQRVYEQLIPRLGAMDWPGAADGIGAQADGDGLEFEIFTRPVRVDAGGVTARGPADLPVAMRIICCHYVLRGGGGRLTGEWVSFRPGDVALGFRALPRVPLRLSFYEADEDFAAEARVLFDRGADGFLDMECLAVTGYLLAELLAAEAAPSPEEPVTQNFGGAVGNRGR